MLQYEFQISIDIIRRMMMRLPPFNPHFAIIIGVIATSTTAILVKLMIGEIPTPVIATYRLIIAFLLMAPYVFWKYLKEFHLIQRKDWILALFASGFLAAHFILWFESLNYTSVVSSVSFITLQPVLVFIGTYALSKSRLSSGTIISLLIPFFGVLVISMGDAQLSREHLFGDVLALLGTVCLTIYILLGQQTRKRLSFLTYTFIIYGIASLMLILYNVFNQNDFTVHGNETWIFILLLAILPTFLGQIVFNYALKWLRVSTVSMGIVFEPIVAAILAYSILGEKVTSSQFLGGTIIIFGLFLFTLSTSRKQKVTISHKK